MGIETSRRSLLTGLGALIAAPAIVRATSIMKVKPERVVRLADHYDPDLLINPPLIVNPAMSWSHDMVAYGNYVFSIRADGQALEARPLDSLDAETLRQLATPEAVVKPRPRV